MRLGQADLRSALNTVLSAGQTQLVFRSQVTPEITIDLAKLSAPGNENQAISSNDSKALRFIKPEIAVRAMGVEKISAPYGRPDVNFWKWIVLSGVLMMGAGAAGAWWLCKKR